MNTPIEKVFNYFYSKIDDYEFLTLDENDSREDLFMKLEMAIATYNPREELEIDEIYETFNRIVSNNECMVLSLYLLCEWLSPQIFNIENLQDRISSKDYQQYSKANFLKEKKELYSYALGLADSMSTKKGHLAKARKKVMSVNELPRR